MGERENYYSKSLRLSVGERESERESEGNSFKGSTRSWRLKNAAPFSGNNGVIKGEKKGRGGIHQALEGGNNYSAGVVCPRERLLLGLTYDYSLVERLSEPNQAQSPTKSYFLLALITPLLTRFLKLKGSKRLEVDINLTTL
jgi:hypothetical protein